MESHKFLLDSRFPQNRSPNVDIMWQSVDYALLSTPTRPGSPRTEEPSSTVDFEFSPSQLFDFPAPDFGALQHIELHDFDELTNLNSIH